MSGTVPFSGLPVTSVSTGDGSAVTARSERLKSQPKERTKKLPVPSGEVARAGVSYPGVAVATVRESKVDKVDSVDWPGAGQISTAFRSGTGGPATRIFSRNSENFFSWHHLLDFSPRNSGGGVAR